MNIVIYTVTHKEFVKPNMDIYKPIVAGAIEHNEAFPDEYILDSCGINISEKHDLYSEFTALYWIWKNSNADIVGENHYRRYFIRGGWLNYFKCQLINNQKLFKYVLSQSDLDKFFSKGYNCILPKMQCHMRYTLYEQYCLYHDGNLFDVTRNIIKTRFHDYLEDFDEMMKLKMNYQKCIFIMNKEMFDDLANWIFSIFDILEGENKKYEPREFAYFGERLINTWIIHNKKSGILRIKELFYINLELRLLSKPFNKDDIIFPLWLEKINYIRHNISNKLFKKNNR